MAMRVKEFTIGTKKHVIVELPPKAKRLSAVGYYIDKVALLWDSGETDDRGLPYEGSAHGEETFWREPKSTVKNLGCITKKGSGAENMSRDREMFKDLGILFENPLRDPGLIPSLELDLYRATQSKVWNKNRTYIFEIVYNV